MRSSLSRYTLLAKRWAWLIILGMALCGGATYIIARLLPPTYEATAHIMIKINGTQSSQNDKTLATLSLIPTFTEVVKDPEVLKNIAENYGITTEQLADMVSAEHVSNTMLMQISVKSNNAQTAAQIANEVANNFLNYLKKIYDGDIAGHLLQAVVPTDPVQPRPMMNAIIGIIVGLGLALALIVIFEWIDDRCKGPEDIQNNIGLDLLTVIPELSARQRSKNAEETPELAESCRILCANLNMAQIIRPFKLVMVTSALAGEGKSTIAANVASFLAMSGKRVLLVDADLRHPVLDQHFQLESREGFSNAFLEMWTRTETHLDGQATEIPSLRVLTAGTLPSNPSELLQSQLAHQLFNYFRNNQKFDYIIFDAPPLLPIADAQILASYIQVTLLVTDASRTPRRAIIRAKQALSRTGTRVLGVALNKSPWSDFGEVSEELSNLQNRPRAEITIAASPNIGSLPSGIEVANTAIIPSNQKF